MPKKEEPLVTSSSHPFDRIWSNDAYRAYAEGVIKSLFRTIELANHPIAIPRKNVFSAPGHPANVSYPPMSVAEGIVERSLKDLEAITAWSKNELFRTYYAEYQLIRLFAEEQHYIVNLLKDRTPIQTGTVVLEVGQK